MPRHETSTAEILSGVVAPRATKYVGLCAGVIAGGTVETTAVGRCDPSGIPVGTDSIFEIGSITKVFTSLLLAEMVVRGDVALDEPLADFFPGRALPVRGRPVTLVDLATHTSGFPRLPRGIFRSAFRHGDNPYARFDASDVSRALERLRLKRPPGERIRYSNFGAAVLGEALARRDGTTYDALLAERVTGPLGLADTTVAVGDAERRAHGHSRRGKPVPDWDMPSLPGMGALHSTVPDLVRLSGAQLEPDSTPLADAIRLSQQVHAGHEGRLRVGLGWMITPVGRPGTGRWMHWHNGGTGGARSFLGFVPDCGIAAVVLTNCARSVDALGVDLLKRLGC